MAYSPSVSHHGRVIFLFAIVVVVVVVRKFGYGRRQKRSKVRFPGFPRDESFT